MWVFKIIMWFFDSFVEKNYVFNKIWLIIGDFVDLNKNMLFFC